MKKWLCALLVSLLVLTQSASGFALNISEGTQRLSEMTDEECVAFVKSYNITIPDDYEELEWADFIRKTIVLVENNPDYFFAYSYTETLRFANEIKAAVNDYYGSSVAFNIVSPASTSAYTLQYSVVCANWSNSFKKFNCYSYALGIDDKKYNPGAFTDEYSWSAGHDVATVAQGVKKDLQSDELGYDCVWISTACPTYSSLDPTQTAIALRTGASDYHFMRLTQSGWVHKPGETTPLMYLYDPDELDFWTNENVVYGVAQEGDIIYDSEVYFITYAVNHSYVYTTTGDHYHSGTRHFYEYADVCKNCLNTKNKTWVSQICSGPPCVLQLGNPPILTTY